MRNNRLKILIVDDSSVVRSLLADLVNELDGVQVVGTARDGSEALALVRRHEPDFVTLDLRMPGVDGRAVLAELKAIEHPPTVAVLTNFPFVEARRHCMDLGADYFLDKMAEMHVLIQVLREAAAAQETISDERGS
jgi:DNA-binding NarL/FixJ family response regulator